jgi:branched-chain amino acid transport system substrate-binding protein
VRRLIGGLALAALTVSGCTGGGDSDDTNAEEFTPAPPPAVELSLLGDQAEPVRLGVVVTSGGPRGEGAEFAALAAGARVAEFRLDEGDDDRVELEVADDRGTSEGAVTATRQLLDSGVAGIVYASAGPHLDAALPLAAAADTAVLLPYDSRDGGSGEAAWRTGPSAGQVTDRISALLAERGQRAPLVLTGEGTGEDLATLADPALRVPLTAGDALAGQVAAAARPLTDGGADAVVVGASAETSAETVAALQGVVPTLPVVLAPSALAPAFGGRLAELGAGGTATTAGQFLTVGPAVSDSSTEPGVAHFLAAVRLAAQDASVPALLAPGTFGQNGAATADVRSHDAVLALATAARQAGSTDPGDVLTALRELELGADDGLAGPELTFGSGQALADDGVAVLQATTRGSGRGVEQGAPALAWFVLPADEG